jgi:hypothetical protein
LPGNNRLGIKLLAVANAKAFYGHGLITKVKNFILLAPAGPKFVESIGNKEKKFYNINTWCFKV